MPSLDALKMNSSLSNLKIFPINVGKENVKKSKKFFKDLNIKNLDIYFDNNSTLAKNFSLRGIPTSLLFNKEGEEFARIIGSIDFSEKEFLDWLSEYN
jgi:thioredoxin-related protein